MYKLFLIFLLSAGLALVPIARAQYDGDPSTGEIFQHVPMYKGDKAPYDGILMNGRRYATLKLAELRLMIGMRDIESLRKDYARLDKVSSQCLKENRRLTASCSTPSPSAPTEDPFFLEDSNFWFGAFSGSFIVGLIAILISNL